jgi:hypothetical protein
MKHALQQQQQGDLCWFGAVVVIAVAAILVILN